MRREKAGALVCAMIAAVVAATDVRAEQSTFTVDPSRSALTLSGGAFSTPGPSLDIEEQVPGSLMTSYTGVIHATITPGSLSPGSITLEGGVLDAQVSGDYLPGSLPSDYGFQADSGVSIIGSMVGAVRDAQFELTSGPLMQQPVGSGFEFSIFNTFATGTAGVVDFGGSPPGTPLGALDGESYTLVDVVSTSVTGLGGAKGSFMTDGLVETLTLPVEIFYQDFVDTAQFDMMLEGTIVATRFVPEPASLVLLATGAVVAIRRRR